ncbi:YozE family protein [Enterococcus wangshanyuanii]|nr:YozE family protein [Enterococcus wangshanyuanii]
MRRSFYHYLMTLRAPKKTAESQFANDAAKDIQFPKQSEDYHEISSYLEMNVDYVSNMFIFDELWEKYLENNK